MRQLIFGASGVGNDNADDGFAKSGSGDVLESSGTEDKSAAAEGSDGDDPDRIYPADLNSSAMMTNATGATSELGESTESKSQIGSLDENVSDFEKVKNVGELLWNTKTTWCEIHEKCSAV